MNIDLRLLYKLHGPIHYKAGANTVHTCNILCCNNCNCSFFVSFLLSFQCCSFDLKHMYVNLQIMEAIKIYIYTL